MQLVPAIVWPRAERLKSGAGQPRAGYRSSAGTRGPSLTEGVRVVNKLRLPPQDFGDYQDGYYSVQTTEGEQIAQLIAGYIDIILKKVKKFTSWWR